MPEDSPSIYTIMAERVANAILGKINALIGSHNTNEQAHQDIREDIPSASSTTPSADTTAGGVGTGTTWSRSDHTHPKSSIYAEASHTHPQYLTSHQDITGKEDKSNKVTSLSSSNTDTQYPSAKAVYDVINTGTITPTNKNFITTSFTPSKLITDSYRERVNNHNSFTLLYDNIGAYCKFDFGCQNNEYYEFDITTSKGSADIYDSESKISYYHLYRDTICTIKITHDELIVHEINIDETTVIDLSNSDGILTFSTKPSTMCQLDFSNKKWYHKATFFDKIYPIGCVHITTNSVNPSNYFDGEWERIQDTFLLASGTTYENGSTGGSATVTLTANQSGLPAHNHTYAHTDTTYKANTTSRKPGTATAANYVTSITGTANNTTKTSNNNTAQNAAEAHNNMPPYLAVYMWERVG